MLKIKSSSSCSPFPWLHCPQPISAWYYILFEADSLVNQGLCG